MLLTYTLTTHFIRYICALLYSEGGLHCFKHNGQFIFFRQTLCESEVCKMLVCLKGNVFV